MNCVSSEGWFFFVSKEVDVEFCLDILTNNCVPLRSLQNSVPGLYDRKSLDLSLKALYSMCCLWQQSFGNKLEQPPVTFKIAVPSFPLKRSKLTLRYYLCMKNLLLWPMLESLWGDMPLLKQNSQVKICLSVGWVRHCILYWRIT